MTLRAHARLLLAALVLMPACDETESVHLRIDHRADPCWGLEPTMCLRILDSSDDDHRPDAIIGFTYEWGYVSELEVEVEHVDDPPEDGSSIRYHLVEIVSETAAAPTETFELPLDVEHVVVDAADGALGLVDGPAIRCEDPAVCDTLRGALADERAVTTRLQHDVLGESLLLREIVSME